MAVNLKLATRSPQSAVAAALLLIPLIYFYPVLIGQVFLAPGDGWMQNLGVRVLVGQMIASGQMPLWNPFIFGGMPLAASIYPGCFYPPNWLFVILSPKWAMNIVVLTTYHIALVGTYQYARRIGLTRLGALIAGTAFTFGGFMINHLSHTSRIAAAAWLPWVLLAIENVAESRDWRQAWRWGCAGALFIALQFFAGEPQMVIFTVLTGLPCAWFAISRRGREDTLHIVTVLTLMLAVGGCLSLIQLLPSLELLGQSERHNPGAQFFDSFSLPPWQLPALVFPYFFGGALLPPYKTPYWGAEIAAVMSGYVGLLTWLLALIALFVSRRNGRVWLWLGIAVFAIVLAFGGHLPFGLNHLLYRVPGYGTFRGLYRHQFEFTFAIAMLAGIGISSLAMLKRELARRALLFVTTAMSFVVIAVAILYRFFGDWLATVKRPAGADLLSNPEFIVPIGCFVLSVTGLWLMQIPSLKPQFSNPVLVLVLLLDLASYGHFFHWRIAKFDVKARLADPPALQLIKGRERDFNSFRVMSHPVQVSDYAYSWPEDPNFDLLNQPNISIIRGLQSISGYDVLRPSRVGEITGTAGSILNGYAQDPKSFSLDDRGFDLLNVKYLIVGYGGATGKKVGYEHDGIYFARTNFGAELKPGSTLTTAAGNVAATEIAIVSSLANSAHLPDGTPILKLKLRACDGRVIERELQAGRDTSEWAYDRADVKAAIKHNRARIAEDFNAGEFKSHAYLGRLKFDRTWIEKIEWIYAREDASLLLIRASLFDETTDQSVPLANFWLPPERWHSLGKFDQVEVYENRQPLPRAWFVKGVKALTDDEILRTIRSGLMPDGRKFDPLEVGLIERGVMEQMSRSAEDVGRVNDSNALKSAEGEARIGIRHYDPQRIEIEMQTHTSGGFLVLSEIYYDGWEARIDGQVTPVYRADYTLRLISVPAGTQRIEFIYHPRSFRLGVAGFAFGAGLLLTCWIFVQVRRSDRSVAGW